MSNEIPATKKAAPRIAPKPDFDKHTASVKAINEQIDATKAQLTKLRDRINQLNATGSSQAESATNQRDALRSKLTQVKKQKADVQRDRDDTIRRIAQLQDQIKAQQEEYKHLKDRLGVTSAEEAEERIRQLESRIASGSLKLLEEKKAINQISQLKRSKPLFDTLRTKAADIANDESELSDLQVKLATLSPSAGDLTSAYDDVKRELDRLADPKTTKYSKLGVLYKERDDLSAKLNELYAQRTREQDTFRVAKEEHYRTMRDERVRKQKVYAEEKKRLELEKLAAIAQEERERAEVPAFVEEIQICTNLIAFVKKEAGIKGSVDVDAGAGLQKETAKAGKAGGAVGKKHQVRKVEAPEKAEVLKRGGGDDEADLLFAGMGGKKKGGKKANKPSTPSAVAAANGDEGATTSTHSQQQQHTVFKFPLTVMEHFWHVKVEVPVSTAEAEAAIKALIDRRAWYQKNSAAVTARNKAAAEAKIARIMAGLEAVGDEADNTSGQDEQGGDEQQEEAVEEPSQEGQVEVGDAPVEEEQQVEGAAMDVEVEA
ncbi:hypothetical protein BCR44DRAFT_128887 [Catenaria anguillulae PL171]|uniref:Nuclear segregation protein Bfr1 n=1 Tax=Catenaria anguillulae PL171 TaxID=765915 RepID=A0A1Y2H5R5_9FUNG|nr:hypothetical protein BCR44DRAFT_128887 [Catenaria anguillulae PL171]